MTWSTRELSDLAGTTVNTVRHYHALGLLGEPPRSSNGYKQYGVRHLVRLLRMRRLAELGIPLSQIGEVSGNDTTNVLHRTGVLLQEEIERIRRSRADIAEILRTGAPIDTPRGFEVVGARLPEPDRALIHVCTQIYPSAVLLRLKLMIAAESAELREQLGALTPSASEFARDRIAENLAAGGAHWRSTLWFELTEAGPTAPHRMRASEQTFIEALAALYNSAQRDVLRRTDVFLRAQARTPETSRQVG